MMRSREQVVDEMLVLAAQAGNTEAFERLAVRWNPRLYRHAYRMTHDAEGAREAVQDAWVSIARGLRRVRDPARFGSWALRITGRRCADWIGRRQKARGRTSTLEDVRAIAEPANGRADDLGRIRDALRRLDPERRALMAMFYVEGMTVYEVAAALGIPPGTVKSRLYNARQRLRAVLEV
jgi:RNA polymerase sigma-70 factor (ECF subfamily)